MPIAEARALGAMALFGEKYGDKVRVVKFGESVELCGGTHVCNTGNIGMVKIIGESSIAAGIRRIEAVSGLGVEKILDSLQDTLQDIRMLLGNVGDVRGAIQKAIGENSALKSQIEDFMKERIKNLSAEALGSARQINGVNLVVVGGPRFPEVVKNVAFEVRKQSPEHTVFVAATEDNGKPLLTLMLTDDLVKQGLNASAIVREAAKLIKGGGGGQQFFAQAGGKDVSGILGARDKMIELLNL